jgi:hypothetical protein
MKRSIRSAAFLVLVLFGCWMAYGMISNVFRDYDDEGYMLLSLRNFSNGKLLYDQIFAQYGPFFYLMQCLVYGLLHAPLTHDGGRMVTLVYWLGAAAAGSSMVFRYSRDLVLSGIAFAAISACEKDLAAEPGHPQQIVILLLMVAGFVSTWVFDGRGRWPALFILGAIGAALLLTKINVGVLYMVALSSALLTFFSSDRARRLGWAAGGFLYGILPLILMRAHWGDGFRALSLLMAASLALLAFASARFPARPILPLQGLAVTAAGFLLAGMATAGAALGQGVSVGGLWEGAFTAALRHPGVFVAPFFLSREAKLLCVPGLILAVIWVTNAGVLYRRRPYITLLQVIGGFGVPLVLLWNSSLGVACAALLFPLGLCHPMPEQQVGRRFTAFFVTHMALLQILQVYPVAGSQVGVAAAVIMAWAFILLADGMAGLPGALPAELHLAAALSQIPLLLAIFAAPMELRAMWREGGSVRKVPSDLPGSSLIHMTPEQAAVYRWMTLNLPKHCDTLFSMPGMGSLNIWSGVPEPSSQFMTAWMSGFSPERQQVVVAALRSHVHPCVVYNRELVQFWSARVKTSADDPLQAYTLAELHPAVAAAGYEIRVPNPAATNWDRDLILTAPHELAGDAIGLPDGLFRRGTNSAISFEVRSGTGGLALQSTCLAKSALPCLGIRSDKLALGTAAKPAGSYGVTLVDGRWHQIVLRDSATEWTVSVDGRTVARTEVDAAGDQSPAYLFTGSGMLQDFVLWHERQP